MRTLLPLFSIALLLGCADQHSLESAQRVTGPEFPQAAFEQRRATMVSDAGTIPPGAFMRAKRQRDVLVAQGAAPEGITSSAWRWEGPTHGGRVRSILIDPFVPDIMLTGSVSGGIWRTTDGGQSWQPVNDFMTNLAICCMAQVQNSPNLVYAGTGEGFFNGDAIRGAGIFKSTDRGLTWMQLTATAAWQCVNRVVYDPFNTDVLLAATEQGLRRSTDAGSAWSDPVFANGQVVHDVDFDPKNRGQVIASGRLASGSTIAVFSDTGGLTWRPATGIPPINLGRIELAYAPSGPSIAYASVWTRSRTVGLFRSTDGGRHYVPLNTSVDYMGKQGWYDNALWVSPHDPDLVVVGGIDLYLKRAGTSALARISDWTVTRKGAHADQHVIVHHPHFDGVNNRTVFVGNDGGIQRADDILSVGTSDWISVNSGLEITQFYGGDVGPFGRILGGTQDNGTLVGEASPNWVKGLGGDGGRCVADPVDSRIMYAEQQFAQIHRSLDGGRTFHSIANFSEAGDEDRAPFVAPFALHPADRDVIFLGTRRLLVTGNARGGFPTQWFEFKPPTPDLSFISAISMPATTGHVYVGHESGDVFQWDINGNWIKVDDSNPLTPLPDRFVTDIESDPNDSRRVYVTFGGFKANKWEKDNVWVTEDAGATWRSASGTGSGALPWAPARTIAVHPDHRGWIYVGTEVGVFSSTDGGETWATSNEGPASVAVDELRFKNGRLYAFTHGRGVYSTVAAPKPVPTGITARVSEGPNGQGNDNSHNGSVTDDGRFLAFSSKANNLVANDTNDAIDVFVSDCQTGEVRRISVGFDGSEATGRSTTPVIAAGGRFVAFDSLAPNLVPNDTNRNWDVFVRDLQKQETVRVSVSSTGAEGNSRSLFPSISPDGRFVAFMSLAQNLVQNDTNGVWDVFVHDLLTRTTHRVSVGHQSQQADAASHIHRRAVSADGRFVVFESAATNLVPVMGHPGVDVFVRDRKLGTTVRVSRNNGGQDADQAAISGDGTSVAFRFVGSSGSNESRDEIYVHRGTIDPTNGWTIGETRRVSFAHDGARAGGDSWDPVLSHDGTIVAFESKASNLVPNDRNREWDVFVRRARFWNGRWDWNRGEIFRASVNPDGAGADLQSRHAELTQDGRLVVFHSHATNLVPGDTNDALDVFVHDRFGIAVTPYGQLRLGHSMPLSVHSPEAPGLSYMVAASFGTSRGMLFDTRRFPLNPDRLMVMSVSTPQIFSNFLGTLGGDGRATATINLPASGLAPGIRIHVAAMLLDLAAPSGIRAMSRATELVVEQ